VAAKKTDGGNCTESANKSRQLTVTADVAGNAGVAGAPPETKSAVQFGKPSEVRKKPIPALFKPKLGITPGDAGKTSDFIGIEDFEKSCEEMKKGEPRMNPVRSKCIVTGNAAVTRNAVVAREGAVTRNAVVARNRAVQ
jgi:hypothetical protein